jgi:hypothetical protein
MPLNLPARGFSFPHVGNGDATTIAVLEDDTYVQIDLNHCQDAENDDDVRVPIIDDLKEALPEKDGKPYLSLFVLTHPDLDHCRGFKRLLDEVTIGEIIHTPRVFREYEATESLSDDAQAFRDEADRRRKRTVEAGGDPGAGHRLRVVGYDELFKEDRYKDFPEGYRHSAGSTISEIDGQDVSDVYEMFVHAPLHDEHAGDRNDSSLAFQVVLKSDGGTELKGLFFGDRTADKIWRVVEETRNHGNDEHGRLDWHVLLASHHCSKYALFYKDDAGALRAHEDLIDALTDGALTDEGAWVVASCKAVDGDGRSAFTNGDGDLPPHTKARERYESMVNASTDFRCTGEHPSTDAPVPVVVEVTDAGVQLGATPEPDKVPERDTSGTKEGFGAPAVIGGAQPSRKTIDHG